MSEVKKDKKEKKKKGEKEREKGVEGKEGKLLDLDFENVERGKVNKVFCSLKDCPVGNVTVYNDRAEVTRTVFATIAAGTNELNVVGLSAKVDSNSVRVAGGKGSATILEVSYNTKWEPKNKDDGSERSRLEREQEELDAKIARFTEIQGRLAKETSWLETWAQSLSKPKKVEPGKEIPATPLFSPAVMEQANNFLEFYSKRLFDIDERRSTADKSLKELREQRERVTKSLQAISGGDTEQVHEVIVLLTAQTESKVELVLSYVVMGASWQAAYDVRVQSNSDDLSLTYYGIITNNSLDDWNEAPLSLSTAQPSVGGAPPELTTKFVGFKQPVYQYHNLQSVTQRAVWTNEAVLAPSSASGRFRNAVYDAPDDVIPQVLTTAVQESSICTSFNIPRKSTILSDNKPHKVTIRIIQLKAQYTYVIIPKLSTHTYLKANILNTSENYPFLPGDINVFMDGNFVAKSHIKAVSPNESFALFLGIDDAIKVTYPPGVFAKDTSGYLRKSNLRTTKHVITVKNTKSKDISVTIFDQLPKSNDSQIKVKLLKPNLGSDPSSSSSFFSFFSFLSFIFFFFLSMLTYHAAVQEGATDVSLTDANNLMWKKEIPSGKQIQLPFEYQLEWPNGQELTL